MSTIERLVKASTSLNSLTDRLLQGESGNQPELHLTRKPTSRDELLRMMRFTQTACAAALTIPVLDELKRRIALLEESPHNFARERLTIDIRQLRYLGHTVARAIIEALCITRDLRCWTHTAPSLLPRWAAFVADELDAGDAEDLRNTAPQ
jgi:hypothetical protein